MNTYVADYSGLYNRANEAVTAALGPIPDGVEVPTVLRNSETLAGRIDHTLLKPDATLSAIETLCAEATGIFVSMRPEIFERLTQLRDA